LNRVIIHKLAASRFLSVLTMLIYWSKKHKYHKGKHWSSVHAIREVGL